MRIDGEHRFSIPRSQVWAHLQDPRSLRDAIPGCVAFEEREPGAYGLTVEVRIGPVRGSFAGRVALRDLQPETRYTLAAEGGGRPGSVSGEADIELADDVDGGTRLRYAAEVTIRGAAARVGGRLLTSTARGMARQFFDAIEQGAAAAAERSAAG